MSAYNFQRRDTAESAITDVFTAAGYYYQQMERTIGFDLLIHGLFAPLALCIEVKARRGALTPRETETRQRIERAGGLYCVLRFAAQAENLVTLAHDATRCHYSLRRISAEIRRLELE